MKWRATSGGPDLPGPLLLLLLLLVELEPLAAEPAAVALDLPRLLLLRPLVRQQVVAQVDIESKV